MSGHRRIGTLVGCGGGGGSDPAPPPPPPDVKPLAGWLNLKDKAATLGLAHLVEHLVPLDYRIEAPLVGEEHFIYWHKRKTDDSAALRVQTNRYVGEWTRESTRADQTRLKECSRDGINWSNRN